MPFPGLRAKLLLLVAIAVVPTLLALYDSAVNERDAAAAVAEQRVLRLVDILSLQQGRALQYHGRLLAALSGLPRIHDYAAGCSRYLGAFVRQDQRYLDLGILAPGGRILCNVGHRPIEPAIFSRSDMQQALRHGRPAVASTGQVRRGRPVLAMAYPIPHGHGAALYGMLDSRWFGVANGAGASPLPPGMTLTWIDDRGEVLARHPATPHSIGQPLLQAGVLARILGQHRGTMAAIAADGTHFYAYAPVVFLSGAPGGYDVAEVPERVLTTRVGRLLDLDITIGTLVAAMAFAVAWLLGDRAILRWVHGLRRAALRLHAGELSARTGLPPGRGELPELARSFDAMAQSLEQRDRAAREAEARYRTLVEQIPAITYAVAPAETPRPFYVSPQIESLLGVHAGELIENPKRWQELVHPDDRQRAAAEFRDGIRRGTPFTREYRLLAHGGRTIWVQDEAVLLKDVQGQPLLVQGVALDKTAQKAAEQALRDSEEKYRILVESANEIILVAQGDRLTFANARAGTALGYAHDELLGRPLVEFLHPNDREQAMARYRQALAGKDRRGIQIFRMRHNNGTVMWMEASVAAITWHGAPAVLAILTDITERVQAEEQLAFLTYHDALTGLPKRTVFLDRASQALQPAERHRRHVAILDLDLDRFQFINDTLGHDAGDRVLKALAGRLADSVRPGDTVARVGGDEFAILLSDIATLTDLPSLVAKIQHALSRELVVDGVEIVATASVGVGLYPADGRSAEQLLQAASRARTQAKERGGNSYAFFADEMTDQARERLAFEASLRRALERNEFLLHYQPQVDLRTGAIVGAEALLRWQHPELGMVSPARFVPLLEETGLIEPVGLWVLHAACRQQRAWRAAGLPPVTVAVNVSGRQLHGPAFGDNLRRVLRECGLPPHHLEIEITESVLMEDARQAAIVLKSLKAAGTTLAIDDFGTGYSSLSYLRQFPVDVLKIDQSFVRDIVHDGDSRAIARAVIALARSLDKRVIAEGVETAEQLALLESERCDCIQGYYFSRPLPAEDFAELLRSGRRLHAPEPTV